jgi:hypothetical protein
MATAAPHAGEARKGLETAYNRAEFTIVGFGR